MGKAAIKPLREQVIVVFGASSGIGRVTAKMAAERGATVVVSARGSEGLETLVSEIAAKGGTALAVPADATSYEEVTAVAAAAVERFGRLDAWAHVAATEIFATFDQTTPDEFQQVVNVNLLGTVHGLKAALPYLASAPNGAFIAVSSVEAHIALPYQSAYAASKHGVHGLIETVRMELEHEKTPVRLTEIMPASINTPLFSHTATKLGVRPQGMPPIYPPEKVAEAILHAATHNDRETVVGGAGKIMIASKKIAPVLTDRVLEKTAFSGQKSAEPRPANDRGNLFASSRTIHEEHGELGGLQAASRAMQWALAGAALGTIALLAISRRGAARENVYATATNRLPETVYADADEYAGA